MQQLTNLGDTLECRIGSTLIRLEVVHGGVSMFVQHGPNRVAELCDGFPDAATARVHARILAEALKGGVSIWQLVQDRINAVHDTAARTAQNAQAVIAAMDDILDGALAEVAADPYTSTADRRERMPDCGGDAAERLNAGRDAEHAARLAAHEAEQAVARDILRDGGSWRRVRPLLTGADAELSEPQKRALALADVNGEIRPQPGVGTATLLSLARKGYGRLVFGGARRYTVAKIVLNEAGRQAAAGVQGSGEAAA